MMLKLFWFCFWLGVAVAVFHEPHVLPWLAGTGLACVAYGKSRAAGARNG